MSTSSTLGFSRPTSPPAYFTLFYSLLIAGVQSLALYDPSSSQEMLGVADANAVRVIGTSFLPTCLFTPDCTNR